MYKGIIYCAISPSNKKYFGRTIQTLSKRKYSHLAASRNGSNLHFHNALRKYGSENFKWIIQEEIKDTNRINKYGSENFKWIIQEEIKDTNRINLIKKLNEREIFYIYINNTLSPNGYNLSKGGGSYNISEISNRKGKTFEEIFGVEKAEEIKRKQSMGRKGKCIGRIQSKEEIKKRTLSNTGKIRTEKTKEKTRQALLGKIFSEERKHNMSLSQIGLPHAQNFGPLRYREDNTAYKKVTKEEEDLILDLYLNKNYGSRKIEKYFNHKFSFVKILKIIRAKGIYKPHKFDGNINRKKLVNATY